MKTKIKVNGMKCSKCEERVENAVKALGVDYVKADRASSLVEVEGNFNLEEVKEAIKDTGFEVE